MIDLSKLRGLDLVLVKLPYEAMLRECLFGSIKHNDKSRGMYIDGTALFTASDIFPIPITPKLLADRCGFSVTNDVSTMLVDNVFDNDKINRLWVMPNPLQRGSWLLCYKDVKIAIDALHELQQAFFVLFRKELEILK